MAAKAARKACLQARVILAKSVALNIKKIIYASRPKKREHIYTSMFFSSAALGLPSPFCFMEALSAKP